MSEPKPEAELMAWVDGAIPTPACMWVDCWAVPRPKTRESSQDIWLCNVHMVHRGWHLTRCSWIHSSGWLCTRCRTPATWVNSNAEPRCEAHADKLLIEHGLILLPSKATK